MCQSFSAPSGSRQRRRCVGTGRRRSARSRQPRRCLPCCPRGSSPSSRGIHPPSQSQRQMRDDANRGALQEPPQQLSLIPSHVLILHEPLLPIRAGERIPPLSEYWATHLALEPSPTPGVAVSSPFRPCRPCRPFRRHPASPERRSWGRSAIIASVVTMSPAIEAASCSATRTTFAGSTMPAFSISTYWSV